tara:strand:+ start:1180 stop:2247 length:1068 start_codon:yes stop_codon:yes gene_type:complete
MACDTPLYAGVQGGSSIETKRCSGPIFPPAGCHATYLYVDEAYLYTIACPIGEKTTDKYDKRKTTPTTSPTATGMPQSRGKLGLGSIGDSLNSTLNSSSVGNSSLNSTLNSSSLNSSLTVSSDSDNSSRTLNSSIQVYDASLEKDTTTPSEALDKLPVYAIVISIICIALSCILVAVYCLMKKSKQRAEQLKRRRSSSVMPTTVTGAPERPLRPFKRLSPEEIQEHREKREIQKVVQKLVNTVCRFNGQYPPAPAAKKRGHKEPPIPPRPRHRRGQPINMRKKTLEYLRRQNPIQTALSKPLEGFAEAGRQRAMRVQAEAAEEGQRQAQWSNKRRGRSRLRNIVRVKELASKGGK